MSSLIVPVAKCVRVVQTANGFLVLPENATVGDALHCSTVEEIGPIVNSIMVRTKLAPTATPPTNPNATTTPTTGSPSLLGGAAPIYGAPMITARAGT